MYACRNQFTLSRGAKSNNEWNEFFTPLRPTKNYGGGFSKQLLPAHLFTSVLIMKRKLQPTNRKSSRRRVLFESLESRRLLAGTELNLPDNVLSISPSFRDVYTNHLGDATINSRIEPATEKEAFALFANRLNTVVLARADRAAGSLVDLELAAYSDQTGDQFRSDDDTNGLNPQFGDLNLADAREVLVLVGDRSETVTGDYTFAVEGPAAISRSLPIGAGLVQLSGNIASQVDYDFFNFTAPTTDTYTIVIQPDAGLDATFNIFNADGTPLRGDFLNPIDNSFVTERTTVDLTAGEPIFIRVDGFDRSTGDFVLAVAPSTFEETFVVNTTDDIVDDADGLVSLREAIGIANAFPGNAQISFAPSLTASGPAVITLTGGELAITDSVSVNGPGLELLTIDAASASRIFSINDGQTSTSAVAIFGLSLINGSTSLDGGAISNSENTTISRLRISGNTAFDGAGIFNEGTLTVNDSIITGNTAIQFGGAIRVNGPTSVLRSELSDNVAFQAGAIGSFSGGVSSTFDQVTISGNRTTNQAGGPGAGVYVFDSQFTFINSTIVNNTAGNGGDGAGIFVDPTDLGNGPGRLALLNTIVANNITTGEGADVAGNVAEATNSLIFSNEGFVFTGVENDNLLGVDPQLQPLAQNGGLSRTHAPLPGSPVIDAGTGVRLLDGFNTNDFANSYNFLGVFSTPRNLPQISNGQANLNVGNGTAAFIRKDQSLANVGDSVQIDFGFNFPIQSTQTFNDFSAGLGLFGTDSGTLLSELRVSTDRAAVPDSFEFLPGPDNAVTLSGVPTGLMNLALTVTSVTDTEITVGYNLRGSGFNPISGTQTLAATNLFFGPVAFNVVNDDAVHDNLIFITSELQGSATDQRGAPFVRTFDGDTVAGAVTDIGAFEVQTLDPSALVVTTLEDEFDFSNNTTSLREAVSLAGGSVGADVVTFDPSLFSGGAATLLLSLGVIDVSSSISIVGPGADLLTIDALSLGRIFNLGGPGAQVYQISGLTFTGGDSGAVGGSAILINDGDDRLEVSGAILRNNFGDGAIEAAFGELLIRDTAIIDNQGAFGAGLILQNVSATIQNVTISGNDASVVGGGIRHFASGADATSSLTILNSTITNNSAPSGANIFSRTQDGALSSTIELRSTIISSPFGGGDNFRAEGPGATFTSLGNNLWDDTSGPTPLDSDLSDTDPQLAPLINNGGSTPTHALLATSPAIDTGVSTVNLIANGGFETGDFTGWVTDPGNTAGRIEVNTGTVDTLVADDPFAPIAGRSDAVVYSTGASTKQLSQSFLVPSSLTAATVSWADRIATSAADFSDPNQEYRVQIEDNSGTVVQVLYSTDPGDSLVQPGPNQRSFDVTALLQSQLGQSLRLNFIVQDDQAAFSVWVDQVSLNVVTAANVGGFDQRGAPFSRFAGIGPDIGAYERQTLAPELLVVNTTSDELDYGNSLVSLREAINNAAGNPESNIITFDPSVFATPQTITIGSQLPTINNSITITGPGANLLTIDADNGTDNAFGTADGYRIFQVDDGSDAVISVTISGLRLTGGDLNSPVFDSGGGAILNQEFLNLFDVALLNNASSGRGGAIDNGSTAVLVIASSTLAGNLAASRAGGGIRNDGVLIVTDSTFSGNSAALDGGGISNAANGPNTPLSQLSIQNSTFVDNTAGGFGQDIQLNGSDPADVNIDNSIFSLAEIFGDFQGANNIENSPGLLGPLQDNGGPTPTHAPLPGSLAIDAGDPAAVAGDGITSETDQRGFLRVVDRLDIGAVEFNPNPLDFGDAPAIYPVTLAQNGARHVASLLFLGSVVIGDAEGVASDEAGAEVDDDGVSVIATLISAAVPTQSSLSVTSSGSGRLDAWIDFNGNGDWLDAGEQVFSSEIVFEGENVLTFIVPANIAIGSTGARFRLSTTGGLAPTGEAPNGEVEDYIAAIVVGSSTAVLEIDSPGSLITVVQEGDNIAVAGDVNVLFTGPATSFGELNLFGPAAENTFLFIGLDVLETSIVRLAGGIGQDSVIVSGAELTLDLTSDQFVPTDIEVINIVGSGNNTLIVSIDSVKNASSTTDKLEVVSDAGDRVRFGDGFTIQRPRFIDGVFTHVITESNPGGTAEVHIRNDRFFQNPLNRFDVSGNGTIQLSDALRVINELARRGRGRIELPTNDSEISRNYFDVSGDNSLSAGDALRVVNAFGRISRGGTAEPEGESRSPVDLNIFVRRFEMTGELESAATPIANNKSRNRHANTDLDFAATDSSQSNLIDEVMRDYSDETATIIGGVILNVMKAGTL